MSTGLLNYVELETGWLATAASQIFYMQLGFLCYEVGYVDKMWAKSIIIKNIEDTFIGTLTFLMIGYTLTTGATYFGIIGKIDNILLLGVDKSLYTSVFVNTCYATTSATIISGAVLERMKNTAYIAYTFLILLINYSLANCWIWNEEGFLHKLGVVDCAGAFIVHSVGGMAGFIAIYNLGPRKGSLVSEQNDEYSDEYSDPDHDTNYKLAPAHEAKQPILMVIGTFILWYGWISFNVTSSMVSNLHIGDNLALCGLNVFLAPCCSALTCWIYCKIKSNSSHKMVNFEHLLSCILSGLVAITGCCFTVPYWSACLVGVLVVPVYFHTSYYIREKLYIDDPLCVSSVHLVPGLFGFFMEGIFADGSAEGFDAGLLYGGYKHFGYQSLAVIIGFLTQLIICVIVWEVFMKRILFKNDSIAISTLDMYLGLGYFDPKYALKEMLLCGDQTEKKMLLSFKQLCDQHARTYELDFLVCITKLKKMKYTKNLKQIYELYCKKDSVKHIHIVKNAQDIIFNNINSKISDCSAYDVAFREIFNGLHHFVKEFLQNYAQNKYKVIDVNVKLKEKYLPFKIDSSWNVQWMTDPVPIIVSPVQEQKIEQRRIWTSKHIAKLSHDSYSDYTTKGNNHGVSEHFSINMGMIKESEKEETNQKDGD